ncbi:hypothetical protein [Undibacterium terreum]|uniref:SH3 domain-containing protein n=1 Tax=Undibacterium terreum TaxID=1224302 RepID=A0A916XNI9_9BURK|nr:hypothetical protein [Undibacterium terreum]GGC89564.1 hypothetical protein GCM10011396_40970 [Undibacterium terreum]
MKRLLALFLLALGCIAHAKDAVIKEYAYTVRSTELKSTPFNDSTTISRLAENNKVEIIMRKAAWTQVKAETLTGWVKMLSLRFGDATPPPKNETSGLQSMYNLVTTGKSGSTVTTGTRGLDEKKLIAPSPNPKAFDAMRTYAVSKPDAQKFAKTEKLDAQSIEYVSASGGKK